MRLPLFNCRELLWIILGRYVNSIRSKYQVLNITVQVLYCFTILSENLNWYSEPLQLLFLELHPVIFLGLYLGKVLKFWQIAHSQNHTHVVFEVDILEVLLLLLDFILPL